ncbi:MAG: MFS transporter [Gammaproteobacteria bacterium]|nr:MFS transporter [Gammaproteobacteria bacterium]
MAGTQRPWFALAVLMMAYTVSFVDRTVLSLLIPPIQHDLGISDTRISLLAGFAFAIFYTLMGIPLGRIADRYNRRNLIAVGITLWCLMTAACGLARSFWQLFAARVGVGVGEAALSPAAYSMISDLFPRNQLGRAIAAYSVGLPIGSGLALLIGGLVVDAVAGLPPVTLPGAGTLQPWQLAFLLTGLPGLLVALLVLLVREPVRRDRTLVTPASAAGGTGTAQEASLLAHLRANRRVLQHHFGGLSLLVIVVFGSTTWIPTFFIRSHGWSAGEVGTAYGVIFMIFGTSGLLVGGQLADRWWRRGRTDAHLRVVLWSVSTMTPCFVLMALVSSAEAALVLLAAATFTSSLHGGVAGAALQLITPNELRGQMTALYFFVVNLVGLGLGPTLVALVTDYGFGDPQALAYSIVVLAGVAGPLSALVVVTGLVHYRASADRLARSTAG